MITVIYFNPELLPLSVCNMSQIVQLLLKINHEKKIILKKHSVYLQNILSL